MPSSGFTPEDLSTDSSSSESTEVTQTSDVGTNLTSVASSDLATDPKDTSKDPEINVASTQATIEKAPTDETGDTAPIVDDDKAEKTTETTAEKVAAEGHVKEEEENPFDVYWALRSDLSDRRYDPDSVNLDKSRKKAPLRLLQYQQYIGLMEDRVRYLERELKDLKKQSGGVQRDETSDDEDDAKTKTESKEPIIRCECLPLLYNEFQKGKIARTCVISTLTEGEELRLRKSGAGMTRPPSEDSSEESRRLSRIIINSNHILKFLEKHLPRDTAPTSSACIILRPFKPICKLENQIRSHLQDLKAEIERRAKEVEIVSAGLDKIALDEEAEDKLSNQSLEDLKTSCDHFELLVTLMDGQLKVELEMNRACHSLEAGSLHQVSFNDLWHLFAPSRVVYADHPNRQAYLVSNVRGGRRLYNATAEQRPSWEEEEKKSKVVLFNNETHSTFYMDCIHIDYDGSKLDFVTHVLEIPYFKGVREIASLPVVPIDLVSQKGDLPFRESLKQRGEKFVRLTREAYAHRDYTGITLPDTDNVTLKSRSRERIDSQVIIDFEHAYLQSGRKPNFSFTTFPDPDEGELPGPTDGTCCSSCRIGRLHCYDDQKLDKAAGKAFLASENLGRPEEALTDLHYIIFPSYVYGYVLRNLEWHRLDVSLLAEPKKHANFDDLVLPGDYKPLVKSLVLSRLKKDKTNVDRSDVVRGKGQGIIILLHGVPGTGKSSTAECVAERLGCPLLTLTCGNIGTKPSEVQESLQTMFFMAQKWNCVMLLDEADVFLQERDEKDMGRNAVVSVFLRALEYYSGILFLTTNKVGKFDEAFVSRIHQAIEYPVLTRDITRSIWGVNLRKLEDNRKDVVFDADDLLAYSVEAFDEQFRANKVTWNGRQIRNAFQTAVALAEFSSKDLFLSEPQTPAPGKQEKQVVELKREHFKQVGNIMDKFEVYLKKTRGSDTIERAYTNQDRHDNRADLAAAQHYSQLIQPQDQFNFGMSNQGGYTSGMMPVNQMPYLAQNLDPYNNGNNIRGPPAQMGYSQTNGQQFQQFGQMNQQPGGQGLPNQNFVNPQGMTQMQQGIPQSQAGMAQPRQVAAIAPGQVPIMNPAMQPHGGMAQNQQYAGFSPGQGQSQMTGVEMQPPAQITTTVQTQRTFG